ncbi:hypothetical protein GCM10025870_02330 [Agromyces marinus]|uniref:Class I SAM-dependent methyltransferase n=1 Tax=Agromyces marinus TaxID=1389020 RepID=A0ABN6YB78_9MICO|nr:hypothetical protein [Agromyces marinus]BDZ53160.1 hypothetical protein GCM10025870_02330 [Agromyces marinus]
MDDCCPRGQTRYEQVFGDRFARALAKRYRRRGLTSPERRIVDAVVEAGIDGATVLEIGGGIGELQLELLRRGGTSTTNLELSGAYEAVARDLAAAEDSRSERDASSAWIWPRTAPKSTRPIT